MDHVPCARATPNAALVAIITINATATGSSLCERSDLHAAALRNRTCARAHAREGSAAAGRKGAAQAGMMNVVQSVGREEGLGER